MSPTPAFPLAAAPVAVVGSRHGSPYGVPQFAAAVVAAGGHVLTGCAAGVDRAAACAAAAAGAPVTRVRALAAATWGQRPARSRVVVAAGQYPSDLATRTRVVVQHAAAVAVFPPAGGVLGPGSALALRLALGRGVPVFVAGPLCPGRGWQAGTIAGVPGWLRLPAPTLF